MTICEDCPRRWKCMLGKPGYVGKVSSSKKNAGVVDQLAGRIWLKRGGGQSSQEQQDSDYDRAQVIVQRRICSNSDL